MAEGAISKSAYVIIMMAQDTSRKTIRPRARAKARQNSCSQPRIEQLQGHLRPSEPRTNHANGRHNRLAIRSQVWNLHRLTGWSRP